MTRRRKRRAPLADKPYDISEGVTQSLLGDFVDCRQRCRYALDGWRMVGSKDSLQYGSLVHYLLEHLYKEVQTQGGVKAADVCAQGAWIDERLTTWRTKQSGRASAGDEQQTELQIAQALAVWDGYLREYPKDLKAGRWIELEGKFDVTWRGFRLRGMRDGLGRVNRLLGLLETKTKSQISPGSLEAKLTFDFQNQFYIVANSAEIDEEITTVWYNILRRPQHKWNPEKESLQEYVGRVAADVSSRPEHWFVRYELSYSKRQLRRFQDELEAKLRDFAGWLKGGLPTYRNEGACEKRWNCPFIKMCAGDETSYERTGRLFEELED